MRLLIVTGIFPPDIGGPATYVPVIAEALTEAGHVVTIVTLSDCVKYNHSVYPYRVVRLPRHLLKPLRRLLTLFVLVLLGRRADLLYVNGLSMESVIANMFLGKPMVHKVVGDIAWERATNWGWVEDSFENFQKKSYGIKVNTLKALRAWWTCRADKVIVPSRYLARWVTEWGVPEEKLKVIYNAVEPANGILPAEVPLKTPFNLVTVVRLVTWKHVDKIIEVLTQLDEVGLIVVGDGPERSRLEQLAADVGVAERVYFAGQCSKAETLSLISACDLFVLNSSYEGLPHVLIEAMQLGLPVVATAVGGTPEVVEDGVNGRLIPPLDDKLLHKALSMFIQNPSERQRFTDRAKQTAKQFSLRRMLEETKTILQSSNDAKT